MAQAKRRGNLEDRKAKAMNAGIRKVSEKEILYSPELKSRLLEKMREPEFPLRDQLLSLEKGQILVSFETAEGKKTKEIFSMDELQKHADQGADNLSILLEHLKNRESEYPCVALLNNNIHFFSFSKDELSF